MMMVTVMVMVMAMVMAMVMVMPAARVKEMPMMTMQLVQVNRGMMTSAAEHVHKLRVAQRGVPVVVARETRVDLLAAGTEADGAAGRLARCDDEHFCSVTCDV